MRKLSQQTQPHDYCWIADDSGVMSQHPPLLPVVMLLWAPRDGDKVLIR